MVKLCLFGPTGSGKSTLANYLVNFYGFELIKISKTLHDLQEIFYSKLELSNSTQDGELLQFLANKAESLSPGKLGELFLKDLKKSNSNLIVNDDCRFNAYFYLKREDFYFIKISTEEKFRIERRKNDVTKFNNSDLTEMNFNSFQFDTTIFNNGSIEDAYLQLDKILSNLKISK